MVKVADPIAFHALNALNRSVMGWQFSFLAVQSSQTDLMSRLYGLGPHLQSSLILLARRCALLLMETITSLKAVANAEKKRMVQERHIRTHNYGDRTNCC